MIYFQTIIYISIILVRVIAEGVCKKRMEFESLKIAYEVEAFPFFFFFKEVVYRATRFLYSHVPREGSNWSDANMY